jgi:hypothetical protein
MVTFWLIYIIKGGFTTNVSRGGFKLKIIARLVNMSISLEVEY